MNHTKTGIPATSPVANPIQTATNALCAFPFVLFVSFVVNCFSCFSCFSV